MKVSWKKALWLSLAAVLVLMAAAPFFRADRFGPRIRAGLEAALGRQVEIGAVRLHLLTGPGFSVRNVIIHEDPAFSPEPFAYVADLVVRIRLSSLLRGRLEFSSLRLDQPRVNLMRNPEGLWNLQGLLGGHKGSGAGDSGPASAMPELEVRRARINFKLNDLKSVYYFTGTDIDFSSAGDGNFNIWLVGEPARTDRTAKGFGRITARGRLRDTGGEPRLNLNVQLDRSALEEMAALVAGRDIGVHGTVSSQAEISGPLSNLVLKGKLDVAELHHWSQPPRAGSIGWAYSGKLNLPAQELSVETDPAQPLRARMELTRYLSAAKWRMEVSATELPLAPAADWLRPAAAEFNGMKLAGVLNGRISAGTGAATEGALDLRDFDWSWGEKGRLQAELVHGIWDAEGLHVEPTNLQLDGQPIQLDCDLAVVNSAWQCRSSSKAHDALSLQRWTRAFGWKAPMLEDLTAGQLRGSLAVSQKGLEPPEWSGNFEVRNAALGLPEFAAPVKLQLAVVHWLPTTVSAPSLRGTLGGLSWQGSYQFDREAVRPHRLALSFDSLDAAELEKMTLPLLRRSRGFLGRALGIGSSTVAVSSGPAEVDVRAKRFVAGALTGMDLRATVWREESRLSVPAVTMLVGGGKWSGSGEVKLPGNAPEYTGSGKFTSLAWAGGVAGGDWSFNAKGIGEDWLRGLQAQGVVKSTFAGMDALQGRFRFDGRRVTADQLEGRAGAVRVPGIARAQADGSIFLDFAGESREVRLLLTLRPLDLAVVEAVAR